jgi:uncharacterized protein YggU (UPF0235/DUF167 family)
MTLWVCAVSDDLRNKIMSIIMRNASESGEGVVVTIRVEEGGEEGLFVESDELVYRTPATIGSGRENAALVSFLARTLRIPSSRIDVVYGARERVKRIMISGIDLEELVLKLLRVIRLI